MRLAYRRWYSAGRPVAYRLGRPVVGPYQFAVVGHYRFNALAWSCAMEYMSAAEVYLGVTGCDLPLDTLPFDENKLPQNTEEAK